MEKTITEHPTTESPESFAFSAVQTVELPVIIHDELGLHARPAARLAQTAQRFESEITLVHGSLTADAKSILDILSLAVTRGSAVTVRCTGKDAALAVESLGLIFENTLISGGA